MGKTVNVESRVHTALLLPDGSVIKGSSHGRAVLTEGLDAGVVRDWAKQSKDQPFMTLGLVKVIEPKAEVPEPVAEPVEPKPEVTEADKGKV